jgi:hypothetical protein
MSVPSSPAKERLRLVVNQIRGSKPLHNYAGMTNKQLADLQETAQAYLIAHPDNTKALERYDLLVDEIKRRQNMGF